MTKERKTVIRAFPIKDTGIYEFKNTTNTKIEASDILVIEGLREHPDDKVIGAINTALSRYATNGIKVELVLNNCQITDQEAISLISNTKDKNILKISLSNNKITDKGAMQLFGYAKIKPSIEEIVLSKNKEIKKVTFDKLEELFKNRVNERKRAEIAPISSPAPTSNIIVKPISSILPKPFEKNILELDLKLIDPAGRLEVLHDDLGILKQDNCEIKLLKIHSQELTDAEILILCNAISSNESLTKIDLSNNKLSLDGIRVLNDTLKSNKFCKISSINFSGNTKELPNNIDNLSKLDEFLKEHYEKRRDFVEQFVYNSKQPNPIATELSSLISRKGTVTGINEKSFIFPFRTPFTFDPTNVKNKELIEKLNAYKESINTKSVTEQNQIYTELKKISSECTKFDQVRGSKIYSGKCITGISFRHPQKDITVDCITDPKGYGIAKTSIKTKELLDENSVFILIGMPNVSENLPGVFVEMTGRSEPTITKNKGSNFQIGTITNVDKLILNNTESAQLAGRH
ncbi:MAG: hypothetical protein K0R98_1480 [Rickettsiaceae bacterium]|jgi:hypothetical protein|nr:hypothetical protein [Rickettsiaceae bacterium]